MQQNYGFSPVHSLSHRLRRRQLPQRGSQKFPIEVLDKLYALAFWPGRSFLLAEAQAGPSKIFTPHFRACSLILA